MRRSHLVLSWVVLTPGVGGVGQAQVCVAPSPGWKGEGVRETPAGKRSSSAVSPRWAWGWHLRGTGHQPVWRIRCAIRTKPHNDWAHTAELFRASRGVWIWCSVAMWCEEGSHALGRFIFLSWYGCSGQQWEATVKGASCRLCNHLGEASWTSPRGAEKDGKELCGKMYKRKKWQSLVSDLIIGKEGKGKGNNSQTFFKTRG